MARPPPSLAPLSGGPGLLPRIGMPVSSSLITDVATAVRRKDVSAIISLIREGRDVDAREAITGLTPLMIASSAGYVPGIEKLLRHKANVHLTTKDGLTALMFACIRGHWTAVQRLLHAGAVVDQADERGETALMKACHNSVPHSFQIVQLLITQGRANPLLRREKDGSTCLDIAVSTRNQAVVEYLTAFLAAAKRKDPGVSSPVLSPTSAPPNGSDLDSISVHSEAAPTPSLRDRPAHLAPLRKPTGHPLQHRMGSSASVPLLPLANLAPNTGLQPAHPLGSPPLSLPSAPPHPLRPALSPAAGSGLTASPSAAASPVNASPSRHQTQLPSQSQSLSQQQAPPPARPRLTHAVSQPSFGEKRSVSSASSQQPSPFAFKPSEWELDRLLSDSECRKLLLRFMKAKLCDENLLFWEACQEFAREAGDAEPERSFRMASAIVQRFIDDNAPQSVNISSRTRAQVLSLFNPPDAALDNWKAMRPRARAAAFEDCEREIHRLMATGVRMDFLASPGFAQLLARRSLHASVAGRGAGQREAAAAAKRSSDAAAAAASVAATLAYAGSEHRGANKAAESFFRRLSGGGKRDVPASVDFGVLGIVSSSNPSAPLRSLSDPLTDPGSYYSSVSASRYLELKQRKDARHNGAAATFSPTHATAARSPSNGTPHSGSGSGSSGKGSHASSPSPSHYASPHFSPGKAMPSARLSPTAAAALAAAAVLPTNAPNVVKLASMALVRAGSILQSPPPP